MKFEFMRNDFEKKIHPIRDAVGRRLEPTFLKDINFRISLILILCTLVNQFLFLICSLKYTSITHSAHACIFYPNTFVKQERNPDTSVGITRRLISF